MTDAPVSLEHLATEAAKLAAASNVTALAGLFEAYLHASDALMGFVGQSRFEKNSASDLIDSEIDRLGVMAGTVTAALSGMTHVRGGLIDKEIRAEALARWAFHTGENVEHVMVVLTNAMTIGEREGGR